MQTVNVYRDVLQRSGCKDPDAILYELRGAGFFTQGLPDTALTTRAYRTLLFLSGALGATSTSVFDELRVVEPSLQRYELVREGMTSRFIKGLLTEPGF